jgi:hypothetical protein
LGGIFCHHSPIRPGKPPFRPNLGKCREKRRIMMQRAAAQKHHPHREAAGKSVVFSWWEDFKSRFGGFSHEYISNNHRPQKDCSLATSPVHGLGAFAGDGDAGGSGTL